MNKRKDQSEQVGEAFAHQVLSDHFGAEVFVGPSIEVKLQELACVIYQEVPDLEYYGATVTYGTGRVYVALNTLQPLRTRYFTAAHELWHLLGIKDMIGQDINQERAADRFAAALMMPESTIRLLWGKLKKDVGDVKAIIMIADMASAPYAAAARRVLELKLPISSEIKKYREDEWVSLRKTCQLTESPLDRSFPFTSFKAYETIIKNEIDEGELDLLGAANKLSKTSPSKAKEYHEKAMSTLASVQEEKETVDEDYE